MPTKELTKTCGICGDKAIGYYNFNAITCDSCKAFFRRNATKSEQFKCYFDGKCKINAMTRKVCKKCRLNKCFAIGMKKEWILTEEEKKWRNHKIEVNRQKRGLSSQNSLTNDCIQSSSSDSSYSDQNSMTSFEKVESIRIKKEREEIDTFSDTDSREHSILAISRPLTDYRNNFYEIEGIKLTELLTAISLMKNSPENRIRYQTIIEDPVIERACMAWAHKCAQEIQKIVRMSKNLSAFRSMCDNDQIALIKYGSVEIYIMRLIMQFDFQNKFWTLSNVRQTKPTILSTKLNNLDNYIDQDNNCVIVKMDLLRQFRKNLFDAYDIFLSKIGPEWDSDPIIIDMLTAVVLFNPDRPNIMHRQEVQFQQNVYMYLLHRYLLLKCRSEYESRLKFSRLMNILVDLHNVTKVHRFNYSRKDPDQVLPLLREIFDVKRGVMQRDNTDNLLAITKKPDNRHLL